RLYRLRSLRRRPGQGGARYQRGQCGLAFRQVDAGLRRLRRDDRRATGSADDVGGRERRTHRHRQLRRARAAARALDGRDGPARTLLSVDVYNVLNAGAVLAYNPAFVPQGTWLQPLMIQTPRFVRIAAEIEF